jgi:hypothetical protein
MCDQPDDDDDVPDQKNILFSRRHFLQGLGTSLALPAFSQLARALPQPVYPFEEIPPAATGITWKHTAGKSPQKYLPETTGSGCAFLDYDNDGWMDIYLVNSGQCDFFNPNPPLRNALYRNNRDGTFTDVTQKAGVAAGGYGQGVAVGDYDGDGFPDLYVTQYGRSILYHNNGDGTFADVTEKAGVAAPGWSSSAVWFDYDNDGRLDLFVCRFLWTSTSPRACPARRATAPDIAFHGSINRWLVGCFTTTGTEHSPMLARLQESAIIWARRGEPLPLTLTTTASWTCSLPTTRCRTFCS